MRQGALAQAPVESPRRRHYLLLWRDDHHKLSAATRGANPRQLARELPLGHPDPGNTFLVVFVDWPEIKVQTLFRLIRPVSAGES
jgi:hypothetical protein